ncbi:VWA domain-containing protein [Pelomicrobium methylotrophicum]|uniref:VWA domain-containing protein n=1 Tax=Pelomicrobium methylotrophicum TaxID=2602750 RepID=A0A5C7EVJ8_9PROT|nr:VWA domain-containing protein [Pelomicrobium methylotrophicum]TXF11285.1 VWA domain-containing protein [Pelomicrobium methylotrophicum]
MDRTELEIEALLTQLERMSFVAHRDVNEALPSIRRHGGEVTCAWLSACHALFSHDREAGKAFIRGSPEAERVSETVLPWTHQALTFLRFRSPGRAVEGFMENLPWAFGTLGHAGEERWAEIGFRWCHRHMESGTLYFRTPVADLVGRQGIAGVEHLTQPAEELFETRRLMLATYLPGAIKVRNLFGPQALLPWAQRGADILQAGRLRGEAYFRLESEESLKVLMEQVPGYRVAEHQRLFGFLLTAWFDAPPQVRESPWSPDKGRAFVETDGRAVYLPVALPEREEAVVGVLHNAGHIACGSFERPQLEALFTAAGVDTLSLSSEGRTSLDPVFATFGDEALRFQLLFDLCEDLRVDARLNRRIPNHLRRLVRLAERRCPWQEASEPYYRAALDTVRLALDESSIASDRRKRLAWETLRGLTEDGATLVDAFRAAKVLLASGEFPRIETVEDFQQAYLPGRSPHGGRGVYPGEAQERSRSGAGEQAGGTPTKERSAKAGRERACCDRSGDAQAAEAATQGANGGSGGEMGGRRAGASAVAGGALHRANERGVPYPEWDYREGRYRRQWAWVQERRLSEANLAEAERLTAAYADALTRLKRAIQAQKPTRLAPRRRQLEGDEVDVDAAVGFITEKRAGRLPLPRVYRQRRPAQRDTSVMLLADLSTSVMQQLPGDQGRIVDRIRAGILLFAEAMEEVGDPYAIAGFSSKYRDNVSYYLIKEFDEPLTTEVRAVVGGLSGRLATRMGAAIRHALTRFAASPCPRRLLLILSDGRPEDYDDGGDIRYLHEDTRVAVKEAVEQGVHPFCITLDPAGSDYLPRIFGRGHFLVLDHLNSLPRKLPEIYLRLRR